MRIVFGLLSLVIVLAIVGTTAKRALHAASAAPAPAASAAAGERAAQTPEALTRKVAEDVGQSMQQAASRAEGSDR